MPPTWLERSCQRYLIPTRITHARRSHDYSHSAYIPILNMRLVANLLPDGENYRHLALAHFTARPTAYIVCTVSSDSGFWRKQLVDINSDMEVTFGPDPTMVWKRIAPVGWERLWSRF